MRALRGVLVYALLVFGAFPALGRWLAHALRGTDGTVVYLVDHAIQLVAIVIFAAVAAACWPRAPRRAAAPVQNAAPAGVA